MFTEKKSNLFEVPTSTKRGKKGNSFIQAGLKMGAETFSENGAKKYSTTGNGFIDQFGSAGQYMSQRSFEDISRDMSVLYAQDKEKAVKFLLYLRLISRKCVLFDGTKTEKVQRGAGLKHEAIARMIWLHVNDEKAFWENIELFISCGSWKDVFEMLRYDLMYHKFEGRVLNWNKMAALILAGLENEKTSDLVKKYLPQIAAKSKCTTVRKQANTIIGKFISNKLFGKDSYADYRKLKTSGKGHEWQQLISKQLYGSIKFDSIHGRALSNLVSSNFLEKHGLEERFVKWIESKPVAKYTGYVHELAAKIEYNMSLYKKMTVNKQFDGLVKLAQDGVNTNTGLIVVRDTSGSMRGQAKGVPVKAGDIAKAMGIFFGEMLQGRFANSWIEFNRQATLNTYKTKTFVDKWQEDRQAGYMGGTDFQSVIDLLVKIKMTGVKESEFPTGIICLSDGEFDPSELGSTNVESARNKMVRAGFSKEYADNFKIILWNIPNGWYSNDTTTKFETFGETENVYYLSGYDGSILSFLLGGSEEDGKATPKTDVELFESAMNQEILSLVKV